MKKDVRVSEGHRGGENPATLDRHSVCDFQPTPTQLVGTASCIQALVAAARAVVSVQLRAIAFDRPGDHTGTITFVPQHRLVLG